MNMELVEIDIYLIIEKDLPEIGRERVTINEVRSFSKDKLEKYVTWQYGQRASFRFRYGNQRCWIEQEYLFYVLESFFYCTPIVLNNNKMEWLSERNTGFYLEFDGTDKDSVKISYTNPRHERRMLHSMVRMPSREFFKVMYAKVEELKMIYEHAGLYEKYWYVDKDHYKSAINSLKEHRII